MAEFTWVMNRIFPVNRQDLCSLVNMFLSRPEILVEQADLVRNAVNSFLVGKAEFTDYSVAYSGRNTGCAYILTFDRKAAKIAGTTLA
jgi:predicted nucleic-acid-binding protein